MYVAGRMTGRPGLRCLSGLLLGWTPMDACNTAGTFVFLPSLNEYFPCALHKDWQNAAAPLNHDELHACQNEDTVSTVERRACSAKHAVH